MYSDKTRGYSHMCERCTSLRTGSKSPKEIEILESLVEEMLGFVSLSYEASVFIVESDRTIR